MMNPFGIPEIEVDELAERLARGDDFLLVDVREQPELQLANLGAGVIHLPLSDLADHHLAAIPAVLTNARERDLVIFCHHGIRSAQVCAYLKGNGWSRVFNLAGGIDAYARRIDPAVGFY